MQKLSLNDDAFFFRPFPYDEFLFLENVVSYEIESQTCINVITSGSGFNRLGVADVRDFQRPIYVVAETFSSNNFGHFFWETVVYLKHFLQIKRRFPNVIFLVKENKRYIKKIFDHYGLPLGKEILPANNYVGFLPFVTSLTTNLSSALYDQLIQEFHYEVNRENGSATDKDIEILYLPRHAKGNFPYENERRLETDSINHFLSGRPNCVVLDTENNDNWADEISAVKRARIIIVPDGSAYAVAGFHAHSSKIIVLGSYMSPTGAIKWDKARKINQLIGKHNQVFFITGSNTADNVEHFNMLDILPILQGKVISPNF